MKLLLDQNISHKLVRSLARAFPKTNHVYILGLSMASDLDIWEYAKKHKYIIVTQDSDFRERATIYGYPPKVIWLRTGNTSTVYIKKLLVDRKKEILAFDKDTRSGCFVLVSLAQVTQQDKVSKK